jgi:hypothetical protein
LLLLVKSFVAVTLLIFDTLPVLMCVAVLQKVAGYTVKAMLAEPKTKRNRQDVGGLGPGGAHPHAGGPHPPDLSMYGPGMQSRLHEYGAMDPLKLQMGAAAAAAAAAGYRGEQVMLGGVRRGFEVAAYSNSIAAREPCVENKQQSEGHRWMPALDSIHDSQYDVLSGGLLLLLVKVLARLHVVCGWITPWIAVL